MNAPNEVIGRIVEWMVAETDRLGELDQEHAVFQIEKIFGKEFVYLNDNGNPAIDKTVLKAFRKATGEALIWDRGYRAWRRRAAHDKPGRQQD